MLQITYASQLLLFQESISTFMLLLKTRQSGFLRKHLTFPETMLYAVKNVGQFFGSSPYCSIVKCKDYKVCFSDLN